MSAHARGIYITVIAKEYDQRWKRCRTTVAIQCNVSAGDNARSTRAITPAVLFYLLDRHALLAMTMGSKCGFLGSLATPPVAQSAPPLRRGELYPAMGRGRQPHSSQRGNLFHKFCTNKKIVILWEFCTSRIFGNFQPFFRQKSPNSA